MDIACITHSRYNNIDEHHTSTTRAPHNHRDHQQLSRSPELRAAGAAAAATAFRCVAACHQWRVLLRACVHQHDALHFVAKSARQMRAHAMREANGIRHHQI
jgi:hypothetical protein